MIFYSVTGELLSRPTVMINDINSVDFQFIICNVTFLCRPIRSITRPWEN